MWAQNSAGVALLANLSLKHIKSMRRRRTEHWEHGMVSKWALTVTAWSRHASDLDCSGLDWWELDLKLTLDGQLNVLRHIRQLGLLHLLLQLLQRLLHQFLLTHKLRVAPVLDT